MEKLAFDFNNVRLECTAILALNGMLANPATSSLPVDTLAQRSLEAARALEKLLAPHVEPHETKTV